MELDIIVRDCNKLLEIVMDNSFKDRKFEVYDSAIIGLWHSLIQKGDTVDTLFKNKKYSCLYIIERSFLEQTAYLKFILKKNSIMRARALFYYQKFNDYKKLKGEIDREEFGDDTEKFKEMADNEVLKDKGPSKNLDEAFAYFKEKYIGLFPTDRCRPDKGDDWYNFEGQTNYPHLIELMKGIGMNNEYLIYRNVSNDVHGSSAPKNVQLSNVDVDTQTADISIGDIIPTEIKQSIYESLYQLFNLFAEFYKVDKITEVKTLKEKNLINLKNSKR